MILVSHLDIFYWKQVLRRGLIQISYGVIIRLSNVFTRVMIELLTGWFMHHFISLVLIYCLKTVLPLHRKVFVQLNYDRRLSHLLFIFIQVFNWWCLLLLLLRWPLLLLLMRADTRGSRELSDEELLQQVLLLGSHGILTGLRFQGWHSGTWCSLGRWSRFS